MELKGKKSQKVQRWSAPSMMIEQKSACCFLQTEHQPSFGSCSAANKVLLKMHFWYPNMTYLAEPLTGVLGLLWQNYAAYGECAVESVVDPGGKRKDDVVVVGLKQACDFGGVHGLAAAASYSAAAVV